MAYYPQNATGLNYISYPQGPSVTPVQLTASASANTKGGFVELAASTAFASNWAAFMIYVTSTTAGTQYLIDIATGAASSETVVVPNILGQGGSLSSRAGAAYVILPLAIASGARVSARCQCSTGGLDCFVAITLWTAGSMPGIATWTNYGANTADSGGTSVDPGAVADTKGAYSQLTASTAAVSQYVVVMTSNGGNAAPVSNAWCVDLSTGGAGSETVLIPDLRYSTLNGTGVGMVNWTPESLSMATYIPASTRLATRASSRSTDASDRLLDIAVLVGTAPSEASGGGGAWAFA